MPAQARKPVRKTAPRKKPNRSTGDAVAAAKAAQKYRAKQQRNGYAPLQIWVPREMRADLLDMLHRMIEEHLALQEPLTPPGDDDGMDSAPPVGARRPGPNAGT